MSIHMLALFVADIERVSLQLQEHSLQVFWGVVEGLPHYCFKRLVVRLNHDHVPAINVSIESITYKHNGQEFFFYLGVPRLRVGEGPRCIGDGLSVLHQSCSQSSLGGIALDCDFFIQVIVSKYGGARDGFLQLTKSGLMWVIPDPFHLFVC